MVSVALHSSCPETARFWELSLGHLVCILSIDDLRSYLTADSQIKLERHRFRYKERTEIHCRVTFVFWTLLFLPEDRVWR